MGIKIRAKFKARLMKHVLKVVWPAGCKCHSRSRCKQLLHQSGPRKHWCHLVPISLSTRSNAKCKMPPQCEFQTPPAIYALKFAPLFITAQSNSAYCHHTLSAGHDVPASYHDGCHGNVPPHATTNAHVSQFRMTLHFASLFPQFVTPATSANTVTRGLEMNLMPLTMLYHYRSFGRYHFA